jgi:hypothetical protein
MATFRFARRDGAPTATLIVSQATLIASYVEVELTPEQLRGMARALASMAEDIEREREP